MLRCQQQDLSAGTIKALLKDGYAVSQLELSVGKIKLFFF